MIWLFALKEMKHYLRNTGTFIFMLAFPLIFMLVLGFALSDAFDSNVKMDGIKVLVNDESSGGLASAFTSFEHELASTGITFEPLKDGDNGRKEVEDNHYAVYVELSDSGIMQYSSSRQMMEANIVQGMLNAFSDKYNAAAAVAKEGGDQEVQLYLQNTGTGSDYIQEQSVAPGRSPGAMDYYAVSMAVMIGLWGAISAVNLVRAEVTRGTSTRLMAAPVRRSEMVIGKVIGSIFVNLLCLLIIIFFSKWVFNAYWGEHLVWVIAVLLAEAVMATLFGFAASELVKGAGARGLVMIIIQLATLFGGAYFPVQNIGMLGTAASLSPIRWGSSALMNIIYDGNTSAAWPAIGLYGGFSVLFLAMTVITMRRKEGI
ncbi:ABC transporter permease [Paenibacillus protaetiae]|uniref:ABC transporter permease n=1 Tax=Paenibacillus protaetiae TaxID=2509456 RepID=A0A4P6ETC1_9BACL|nr:ABC transporter permease [Paenibacillus protaetiae]QAY65293.1 ABC transporter permease [Paenibacillus protaetiae]